MIKVFLELLTKKFQKHVNNRSGWDELAKLKIAQLFEEAKAETTLEILEELEKMGKKEWGMFGKEVEK